LHTTGFAFDGETWTRSNDESFAAFKASDKAISPFFSPSESISRTSLAFIL
tara:strand:- start:1628 stop:1780 length:153 start_codon:yes stop_codon:yes gene_type:complete